MIAFILLWIGASEEIIQKGEKVIKYFYIRYRSTISIE